MYVLFGLLPFILGGIVAGLLCKGYRKGVMAGGLVGVNLMVGMVLMMGVLVLLGSLAGLYLGTPIDVVSIFSGLYEGAFGRNTQSQNRSRIAYEGSHREGGKKTINNCGNTGKNFNQRFGNGPKFLAGIFR